MVGRTHRLVVWSNHLPHRSRHAASQTKPAVQLCAVYTAYSVNISARLKNKYDFTTDRELYTPMTIFIDILMFC